MSRRLTLAEIKASRIPTVLNLCPTDIRLLQFLNEAQERLLMQGRWWGAYQEAQFCVTEGCIVMPREVAVIEQVSICGVPLGMQNAWGQWSHPVASCGDCDSCADSTYSCGHSKLESRGFAPSFKTTTSTDKKIRVYPGNIADVGKKIIFQGRDSTGNWVRTTIDGVQADGEQVTLALPFVETTTTWGPGAPTGVIKEATQYRVLVYSVVGASLVLLADYQPSEINPMFRKYYLPGFSDITCCGCEEADDGTLQRTVNAMVSLQHVPIEVDTDWLIFQSLSAYKEAMIAVKAWEEGEETKANFHFYGTQNSPKNGRNAMRVVNRGGAIPLLQAELRKQTGDHTEVNVQLEAGNSLPRAMAGFR